MHNLTLQVYGSGLWQDAMDLSFTEPSMGFLSPCRFAYKSAYVYASDQHFLEYAYEQGAAIGGATGAGGEAPKLLMTQGALRQLDQRLTDWGLQ